MKSLVYSNFLEDFMKKITTAKQKKWVIKWCGTGWELTDGRRSYLHNDIADARKARIAYAKDDRLAN